MLKIEMLLAGHGDCLWIEYGDPQAPRRVLIDGGLGSINAPGFAKNGHVYTNAAYGQTKIQIDLEIDAGIGQIDLKMRGVSDSD